MHIKYVHLKKLTLKSKKENVCKYANNCFHKKEEKIIKCIEEIKSKIL